MKKKKQLSTFKFFLVALSLLILEMGWYDYLFKKLYIYLYTYLAMLGLSCKHTGSLAVAWGISAPWPGVEPGPLHWERGVLATGPPGKSHEFTF